MKGLWTRLLSTLALCGACVGAGAADGQGLTVDPDQLPWPRLQTRLAVQSAITTNIALGSRTGPEKGDWLTAPDRPGDLGQTASGPGACPLFPRAQSDREVL